MTYLYLGSLKRDSDHGDLLNSTVDTLVQTPGNRRKQAILKRLEVSEVVEYLGLSDALLGLYLSHKGEIGEDSDALKAGFVDLVSRHFGSRAASPAPIPVVGRAVEPQSVPQEKGKADEGGYTESAPSSAGITTPQPSKAQPVTATESSRRAAPSEPATVVEKPKEDADDSDSLPLAGFMSIN